MQHDTNNSYFDDFNHNIRVIVAIMLVWNRTSTLLLISRCLGTQEPAVLLLVLVVHRGWALGRRRRGGRQLLEYERDKGLRQFIEALDVRRAPERGPETAALALVGPRRQRVCVPEHCRQPHACRART